MPTLLLNKPFRVLCQFKDPEGRPTLSDFIDVPDVYPAGRLDFDSEGLQARISEPRAKTVKTYRVQVEGDATEEQLSQLSSGVQLKDGKAIALSARRIEAPVNLWPRDPPIRHRATVPDSWIEIGITEGRNRQVRRMTAAVGLPTLRLIRWSIGPFTLDGLRPGETRLISNEDAWRLL